MDLAELQRRITAAETSLASREDLEEQPGDTPPEDGTVLVVEGLFYRRRAASTLIPDIPGWNPAFEVTPDHFGTDATGATGASDDLGLAVMAAATLGLVLRITSGTYLADSSVSVVLPGSVTVEFDPGAQINAASGLAASVMNLRGSSSELATWLPIDLTIINPQIDCTLGTSGVGGAFCTGISASNLRNVKVLGGRIYGGEEPDNVNADSGISLTNNGNVEIAGVDIRGFNDTAIYPGGNNMLGTDGDGGVVRIHGCVITRSAQALAAKRELRHVIFENNVVEECLAGVATADVDNDVDVPGALRMDVLSNKFRKIRANVIRPRGAAKGRISDNDIIDIGYRYDGTDSAGGSAVAINLDGSIGADVRDNRLAMQEWTPVNQCGVRFSEHTFDGDTFTHGGCFLTGNSYRGFPRGYVFTDAGDPHTALGEYFEDCTTPISATNLNAASLFTYADETGLWVRTGGVTRYLGPAAGPYADNAAAVSAGLAVGRAYYTATGELRQVV
jgi:hypothetical protein